MSGLALHAPDGGRWAAAAPSRTGRGHVLLSVNTTWNVANFRAGLVRSLQAQGYQVTVAAPADAHVAAVEALGCRFVDLPMEAHGRSPFADLGLLARYLKLFREVRPDWYLGFTAKPNIYGSFAAALARIPAINNIAGLGQVFAEQGVTKVVLRRLYRLALARSTRVFFQNGDDLELFVGAGLAPAGRSALLPGSGVDLARFAPTLPAATAERFVFLLCARLLRAKGVAELVAAGRRLRERHPHAEVRLLGFVGDGPAFVPRAEIEAWQAAGDITYLGQTDDVRPHLAAADCVVLPTYYPEGTPRALLEAAAMEKPLITCDLPGCRDVVVSDVNGWLVPPRDVEALAAAMERVVELAPEERAAMGRRSRALAESRFDERLVHAAYSAVLDG